MGREREERKKKKMMMMIESPNAVQRGDRRLSELREWEAAA